MEFEGSWSLDGGSSGFEKMESGINARAIDFAKFGRLFLRKGNWEGTQVIPASWVEESTQEDTSLNRENYYPKKGVLGVLKNGYYKYMWWGISRGENEFDFFALGNHGQFIYVAPQKNLIIVRNGESFGKSRMQWIEGFRAFADAL
jgi:CubicO group peptidase (beta-lactamase class C family)